MSYMLFFARTPARWQLLCVQHISHPVEHGHSRSWYCLCQLHKQGTDYRVGFRLLLLMHVFSPLNVRHVVYDTDYFCCHHCNSRFFYHSCFLGFVKLICCYFQIFETVFYIAIDHQSRSVVIAVRGTLSLNVSCLYFSFLIFFSHFHNICI